MHVQLSHAVSGKRIRLPLAYFAIALALAPIATHQAQAQGLQLTGAIPLPNNKKIVGFDISWVDADSRIYLLADGTNASVDMVDLNTNNVSMISGFHTNADPNVSRSELSGPNGVTTVNHIEAWAGDGPSVTGPVVKNSSPVTAYATDNCDSSVKVIDLVTQQITDTINTGGCFRADELAFDPVDQVFLVANPSEQNIGKTSSVPFVTLISTQPVLPGQHHKILAKINFDGTNGTPNSAGVGIEQSVWSPKTGLFYIVAPTNGPSDAVAVVDPRGRAADIQVVNTYPIQNCGPTGASLGPGYTLFIGCGAGPVQVMDIRNGNIRATIPQVSGVDEVWYDAGNGLFVAPSFAGQFGVIDANTFQFIQNIPSNPTSAPGVTHSVASDPVTKQVFVPAPANDTLCGPAPNLGCIAVFGPASQ